MDLTIYAKQLETYLKNHGIDATVKYDTFVHEHRIQFTTTRERTIYVRFDDILTDYALVASMISTYRLIDQQIESDSNKCEIKQINNNEVSIDLTVNANIRDTTIKLASGTELFIELFDPYSKLDLTFSRLKTVSRANLNSELKNEVQAIINDAKQYCN